jgi:hypothetical protein
VNALTRYIELIVEPTVEEFNRNSTSLRHAYLACVATFHAIDRAAEMTNRRARDLRQVWGRQSQEFKLVDIVAHDFKHIRASNRSGAPDRIPVSMALYGQMGFNTHMYNDTGQVETLQHLTFIVGEAVEFIKSQAAQLKTA